VGKYVHYNHETAKIEFCTSLKSVNYFRFVPETIVFETKFLSGMQNLVKSVKNCGRNRSRPDEIDTENRHLHLSKIRVLFLVSLTIEYKVNAD